MALVLVLGAGLSALGWGIVAARLLRVEGDGLRHCVLLAWLGWAFTLTLLHLEHFFVPLTAVWVGPTYVAGGVVAIASLRGVTRRVVARKWQFLASAFGWTLVAIWILSRAMAPPDAYDYGLYHHNTVQWVNAYPVVPGLGNLHDRLAYNQASLVYVASLNLAPFFGHGRVVAITLLTLLMAGSVASSIFAGPARGALGRALSGHEGRCALFLVPFAAYVVVARPEFSSAAPDLVSTLFQIAIFLLLCRVVDRWNAGTEVGAEVRALAFLAAAAITVKLSNLGFAAVLGTIAIAHVWRGVLRRRALARLCWLPAATLVVWCSRGVVLSGMPLFPSTLGRLPVDWAIPRLAAESAANWVYSWARQPGPHWRDVLGRWDWLEPWATSMQGRIVEFVGPLVVLVILTLALVALALRGPRSWTLRDGWLIAGPFCGVVFWFSTAPEPRFLGAQLWLLVVASGSLLIRSSRLAGPVSRVVVTALLLPLYLAPPVLQIRRDPWQIDLRTRGEAQNFSVSGFHEVRRVPLRTIRNSQGVQFFVPRDSDQCWDSPQPCTGYEEVRPLLRDVDSLAAGFRSPW